MHKACIFLLYAATNFVHARFPLSRFADRYTSLLVSPKFVSGALCRVKRKSCALLKRSHTMLSHGKVHPHHDSFKRDDAALDVVTHFAPSIDVEAQAPSEQLIVVAPCTDDVAIDKLQSTLVPNSLITLKEQMEIEFSDKKRQEASRKMKKKLDEMDDDKKLKNNIITFKYATDYTFLRRSSPEDVWEAILRREAWRQIPVAMVVVTLVQVCICSIVMIAKSAPVNLSTLIMAVMYVVAMATSNPFIITKELNAILLKQYNKRIKTKNQQIFLVSLCVLFSPIVLVAAICAYSVTAILDFTTGPILDVSFGSMVNIIVNIIVVFSALSIGLRSEDPINAIQTFVGFDFINNMDESIIAYVNVDLMAHTKRINPHTTKTMIVRAIVYTATLFVLGATFYLTISNKCVIFCSGPVQLR